MDYRMTINGREERVRIDERGGAGRYQVAIGDRTYEVDAARLSGSSTLSLLIDGRSREAEVVAESSGYLVQLLTRSFHVGVQDEVLAAAGQRPRQAGAAGKLELTSPMPGLVVEVKAAAGQRVTAGQPLVIVEAMKMQNEFGATADGVVKEIKVRPGQTVAAGQVLVTFDGAS